jgi:hypothetical protein
MGALIPTFSARCARLDRYAWRQRVRSWRLAPIPVHWGRARSAPMRESADCSRSLCRPARSRGSGQGVHAKCSRVGRRPSKTQRGDTHRRHGFRGISRLSAGASCYSVARDAPCRSHRRLRLVLSRMILRPRQRCSPARTRQKKIVIKNMSPVRGGEVAERAARSAGTAHGRALA